MKTSELTGAALDWAVMHALYPGNTLAFFHARYRLGDFRYSISWDQSGLIIEREHIALNWLAHTHPEPQWMASYAGGYNSPSVPRFGSTPLIAAMRCFVASKLGDEVDIPEELL